VKANSPLPTDSGLFASKFVQHHVVPRDERVPVNRRGGGAAAAEKQRQTAENRPYVKSDFHLHDCLLLPSQTQTKSLNFMAKLFLGLDSSTQSLSAVVIDLDTRKVIYEKSLNFDRALPHYKTRNGVLPNRDPLVKHSPPLMWAEALDLLFAQMKNDGVRWIKSSPSAAAASSTARFI
jgi:hypothetical protein